MKVYAYEHYLTNGRGPLWCPDWDAVNSVKIVEKTKPCCQPMKALLGGFITLDEHKGVMQLQFSESYEGDPPSTYEYKIDFCPFCGEKIDIEKVAHMMENRRKLYEVETPEH